MWTATPNVAKMIHIKNPICKLIFKKMFFVFVLEFNKRSRFQKLQFSGKYFMVQALQG